MCLTHASLCEENPKTSCAHPGPVCLLASSEAVEALYIKPKVLLLVTWLSGEVRSNFAVIFELSSAVTREKLFSPCSKGNVGNVPFFFSLFFFDSGPSNQLHLHSGGIASSHMLPNSHLPVQLMACLLLP